MGIEFDLSFNGEAAFAVLETKYEEAVESLCDLILAHARVNLEGEYPEVEHSLRPAVVQLVNGVIGGTVAADHWKSYLAEWGSGSEMDISNDALAAYMASPYWNPDRVGMAITGRAAGPYLGLDGETHDKHTGALAGVNLEDLSRNDPHFQAWMESVGLPEDAFQPKRPLHFMKSAVLANEKLILDQLRAVVEVFQFGDFFM